MNSIYLFKQLLSAFPPSPIPEEPIYGEVGWGNIKSERPCIDKIRFAKKISSHRNNHIFVVATEHRRRGWDLEMSEKDCLRLNEQAFDMRLKKNEVVNTVRSAHKGQAAHRCDNEILNVFCIGFERCEWIKEVNRKRDYKIKDHKESVFEDNWLGLLRMPEVAVYNQFRLIEKKRGVPPGGLLTLSQRSLAQEMKLKDKGVGARAMKKLNKLGLIEVLFEGRGGSPLATGFATAIQRIIPIPKPGEANGNNKK